MIQSAKGKIKLCLSNENGHFYAMNLNVAIGTNINQYINLPYE